MLRPRGLMLLNCVLEKTLERPLDCKEMQPVHPKGNKSWIFIKRTEAKSPILWPPDGKRLPIGKDPDALKDWEQEEKGMTEDKVGWHYWLNGHESEKTQGDSEGQGSLVCCNPWDHKELDATNWATEQQLFTVIFISIINLLVLLALLCF